MTALTPKQTIDLTRDIDAQVIGQVPPTTLTPKQAIDLTQSYQTIIASFPATIVGPAGAGFPIGGTTGELLTKQSPSDYDAVWAPPAETGLHPIGSRVDLAALPPDRTIAFLVEAGRQGTFQWAPGNLSAQVANDPSQGVYVPPIGQSGSTGAWVRQFYTGLRPEWFGAVGDGNVTHMTADTHGLQMAINFSAYSRLPITPGEATYIIDGYKGDQPVWAPGELSSGGLLMRDGANIWGAGRGKTILKNGANNWRCVIQIQNGTNSIRDLTIDGDVDHHPPIPLGVGGTNASQGANRGEGIILWNGTIPYFEFTRLEVKNTGHYGMGIQNVGVDGGFIENPIFENIGGDCIDVKAYGTGTGDAKRGIYIHNFVTKDGAGHNYYGKYGNLAEGHDDQTCIDLADDCHVQGAFIYGLDCEGPSISVCGVRFRPQGDGTVDGRTGSRGASANMVRINSTMAANTGNGNSKDVCGIEASSNGHFDISDAIVDGGFSGCRIISGSNGSPLSGSISGLLVKNISGDGLTRAYGFELGSGVRGIYGRNITIQNCEYGARVNCTECDVDLRIEDSRITQVVSSDTTFDRNNVKLSFTRRNVTPSGGDIDPVTAPIAASNQVGGVSPIAQIFGGEVDIIQPRRAYINLVATANDGSWTGDDPVTGNRILGGVQILGGDVDGFGPGIKAAMRGKADGPAGSTCYLEFTTTSQTNHDIPAFRMQNNKNVSLLPLALRGYTKAELLALDPSSYARTMAFLEDPVGNKHLVICDLSFWRYPDGTPVF